MYALVLARVLAWFCSIRLDVHVYFFFFSEHNFILGMETLLITDGLLSHALCGFMCRLKLAFSPFSHQVLDLASQSIFVRVHTFLSGYVLQQNMF